MKVVGAEGTRGRREGNGSPIWLSQAQEDGKS